MKKIKSFLALDFEYLVRSRYDTPCAVGLVKVMDGVVVQKLYTLIRPTVGQGEPLAPNNGITWQMVEHAPTFAEVYPHIVAMADGLTLVAHNFSTERKVLIESCTTYDVEQTLYLDNNCDTYIMSGQRSLPDCCAALGIPLAHHHNALDDAEACAHLFMRLQGEEIEREQVRTMPTRSAMSRYKQEQAECNPEVYRPLSDDEVKNKNTPFFGGVKTVISGTFELFPDRNKLKQLLKELGADVDTNVGKHTQILVVGQDAGPSKLKKAEEQGVRIMTEEEFVKIVSFIL